MRETVDALCIATALERRRIYQGLHPFRLSMVQLENYARYHRIQQLQSKVATLKLELEEAKVLLLNKFKPRHRR